MANSVDLIIGSEAIKQIEKAINLLSIADQKVLDISQSSLLASKGLTSIGTPSGLDKAVTNTTALNAELERQNAIIKNLELEIKKLSYARQNNNKQTAAEAVNQRILNQNAIAEAKATSALVGAYDKLNLEHKKAIINAQNLGVKYGETSTQFLKAADKANILDTKLKAIDATIGKNQRNVGNYASGYNALGNSINQLSREAPAFANSVNTGFMALSNNFPALFDAINGIRDKNKMLVAEGKPTTSVLKSIAGAVLSWQTALSVGVTLLTLYGGKIVEWVIAISKGADGIRTLKENQTALNDAVKEGNKDASKEISQLDILYRTATNVALSTEQRLKAVNKLQETYPSYFADINDEIIMNGKATKSYETLREAIFESARAKAIQSTLETRASERLDKEMKLREDILEIETKLAKQRADPKAFLGGEDNAEIFSANEVTANLQNNLSKRNALLRKFREDSLKEDDLLLKAKEKAENKSAVLEADRIKEPKGKKAAQTKAKREDLAYLESYVKPVGNIVEEINAQIESLKVIRITGTPEEREEAKKDIQTLIKLKKELQGGSPTGGALPDFVVPDNTDGQTKLKTDWKDTFDSIAESAQQAGDIMAEFSQRRFEGEYRRLEAQKDISLKFAGESDEAKKKIEEDYEKRRKEIANRENKAKQRQAIFNIAIDTAQAIMKNYGQAGFIGGTAMAVITAALGAAQIAMVLSQKIPEYFSGTDNHAGGLMIVNDGGGSNFQEKVVLPNGKEIMPEGRNVLMNAPKGTKVLTHEQQIMEMLNERGISMSRNYQSNGGMTASEMDSVMAKHFAKIQVSQTTYDRNGFSNWIGANGNKTIQNNNRVSRVGFKV